MDTLNLDKFSPKEAELRLLAESCKTLDTTDLKAVGETRKKLKATRVEITKTGKAMRDDANKFATAVIAREKELVAIIEPDERRLEAIEDEYNKQKEREARVALLPVRRERLKSIKDNISTSDDEILDMDGPTFEGFFNKILADKNEADRLEIERVKAEQYAEAIRIEWEASAKEREEKARADERFRIERETSEAVALKAKQEAEAQVAIEAEQVRLQSQVKYKKWLDDAGYSDVPDQKLVDKGPTVELWKLVRTFNK